MLDRDHLLADLRSFCDADYSDFQGSPTTRDEARHAWANAFADYAGHLQEAIVPPADGHPTIDMTGVADAFYRALQLTLSMSAPDSAADFAGAWQQSIDAITIGSSVTDGSLTQYVFVSFSNVASLHDALQATLTALFEAPSIALVPRLTDIASAFHTATSGLLMSVTITTSSGATSSGSIGVL